MKQKRDSDGSTVDLSHEESEQADTTARAKRVLVVNSAGTAIKIAQIEENQLGSDCSGSDGATSRVLTLANTSTSGAPVAVWVEEQLIAQSDLTTVHKAASSTITFGITISNTDVIRVRYYI